MIIQEGAVIDVKIVKEILLPSGMMALLGQYNQRSFILNKNQFENLEIVFGKTIACHVDKVNCTGKIYLSPYKSRSLIGSIEEFSILNHEVVQDSLNNTKYLLHLLGNSSLKAQHITYIKPIEKSQNYIIRDINKSKYILEPLDSASCNYKYEQEIEVDIIDKKEIQILGECLIVADHFNRKHLISYSKFRHYNLNIGDTVKCRIRGFDKQHNLKLEPSNPKYKLGKTYSFETIDFIDSTDESNNPTKILRVNDCLGMQATIVQLPSDYKLTKNITAKVYRINNGRLYLSYEST